MIALMRGAACIDRAIRRGVSRRPLILMLTGTDLYADIRVDASARFSLKLATRLVVLQQEGLAELAPRLRARARVIYQSTRTVRRAAVAVAFEVCVSGHLRDVKDPFRLAAALGHLPAQSQMRGANRWGAINSADQTGSDAAAAGCGVSRATVG